MKDQHDASCKWEEGGRPCLRFSTDGTALGADIAHAMGTTNEEDIVMGTYGQPVFISDVHDEQAEWESDRVDTLSWGSAVPAVRRRVCRRVPPSDMHEPPPYPSAGLEWTD